MPKIALVQNKKVGPGPGSRVYVLFHCIVVLEPGRYHVEEALFFVATAKSIVRKYFRALRIQDGAWWQVGWGRLNGFPCTIEGFRMFSRDGIELKTPPIKMGYRAALKQSREEAERALLRLREARRQGCPKNEITRWEDWLRRAQLKLKGHPISKARLSQSIRHPRLSKSEKEFLKGVFGPLDARQGSVKARLW